MSSDQQTPPRRPSLADDLRAAFHPDATAPLHDVVLRCLFGAPVPSHSAILSSRSPRLRRLFELDWAGRKAARTETFLPFKSKTVRDIVIYLVTDASECLEEWDRLNKEGATAATAATAAAITDQLRHMTEVAAASHMLDIAQLRDQIHAEIRRTAAESNSLHARLMALEIICSHEGLHDGCDIAAIWRSLDVAAITNAKNGEPPPVHVLSASSMEMLVAESEEPAALVATFAVVKCWATHPPSHRAAAEKIASRFDFSGADPVFMLSTVAPSGLVSLAKVHEVLNVSVPDYLKRASEEHARAIHKLDVEFHLKKSARDAKHIKRVESMKKDIQKLMGEVVALKASVRKSDQEAECHRDEARRARNNLAAASSEKASTQASLKSVRIELLAVQTQLQKRGEEVEKALTETQRQREIAEEAVHDAHFYMGQLDGEVIEVPERGAGKRRVHKTKRLDPTGGNGKGSKRRKILSKEESMLHQDQQ